MLFGRGEKGIDAGDMGGGTNGALGVAVGASCAGQECDAVEGGCSIVAECRVIRT